MIEALLLLLLLMFSYMLGNINFAKIFARLKNDDITTHGSGNPGTMNMLRTHGFVFAIITLVCDGLKGAIPATLTYFMFGGADGGYTAVYFTHLVGFMAVVGHIFPVINKFKGGKGVATAFGYFTVINPVASLILFALGCVIFALSKIASVATLTYIAGFIVWQIVLNYNIEYLYALMILVTTAILIFVVHRNNMKRFFKKQESKIDFAETLKKDKQLIEKGLGKLNTKNSGFDKNKK